MTKLSDYVREKNNCSDFKIIVCHVRRNSEEKSAANRLRSLFPLPVLTTVFTPLNIDGGEHGYTDVHYRITHLCNAFEIGIQLQ